MTKIFKGELIQSNKKTKNNRIYPTDILVNAINEFSKNVDDRIAIGEIGIVEHSTIMLNRATHKINSIKLIFPKLPRKKKKLMKKMGKYERDTCMVTYEFLKNNSGTEALRVHEKIGLYPCIRGVGSVDENGVVKNDFKLLAVDLVLKKDKA